MSLCLWPRHSECRPCACVCECDGHVITSPRQSCYHLTLYNNYLTPYSHSFTHSLTHTRLDFKQFPWKPLLAALILRDQSTLMRDLQHTPTKSGIVFVIFWLSTCSLPSPTNEPCPFDPLPLSTAVRHASSSSRSSCKDIECLQSRVTWKLPYRALYDHKCALTW